MGHLYQLYIIEDNPSQLRLMQEAIIEAKLNNMIELHHAYDGEQACEYLDKCKVFDKRVDLVITDLNLPRVSGKEVLRKIKSDAQLKYIPVIIFTNSDYREDMLACYELGADGYMQKPGDFVNLIDFFISIKKSIEIHHQLSIRFIAKSYDELRMAG